MEPIVWVILALIVLAIVAVVVALRRRHRGSVIAVNRRRR